MHGWEHGVAFTGEAAGQRPQEWKLLRLPAGFLLSRHNRRPHHKQRAILQRHLHPKTDPPPLAEHPTPPPCLPGPPTLVAVGPLPLLGCLLILILVNVLILGLLLLLKRHRGSRQGAVVRRLGKQTGQVCVQGWVGSARVRRAGWAVVAVGPWSGLTRGRCGDVGPCHTGGAGCQREALQRVQT